MGHSRSQMRAQGFGKIANVCIPNFQLAHQGVLRAFPVIAVDNYRRCFAIGRNVLAKRIGQSIDFRAAHPLQVGQFDKRQTFPGFFHQPCAHGIKKLIHNSP